MTQLGEYRILEKIAEGGMATVYKGVQSALGQAVAVKVMSRDLADDPELVRRFDRESMIMARLSHPNIIRLIDKGMTAANNAYFVMEYVEGTDLARLIAARRLTVARKLDIILQVCRALSYAHKNGVIHRDVKPANILVAGDGKVLVTDFGTAQLSLPDLTQSDLTRVGTVMGTLSYMSPEQRADSSGVTAASDVFSLGVVLYELFTGRKPVGRYKAPSTLAPGLPPALDALIERCLEPEPRLRPAAEEVRSELLRLSQGRHLDRSQREQAAHTLAGLKDQFQLLDVIKADRYSAVYLYQHRRQQTLMVIKRLASGQAGLRESSALAQRQHPHVARVLGTAHSERSYIVVMEYLPGGSLQERLLRPLPLQRALQILAETCAGLAFAHEQGIVHGNLRPSNVLFDDEGRAKVTDFGLDEHYRERQPADNWYNAYCQQRSKATDLLAAGTLLYQMLCGGLPAWGQDPARQSDLFAQLPAGVQRLIRGMIDPSPRRRYAHCGQVLDDLRRLQNDPADQRVARRLERGTGRRFWWWLGGGLLVLDVLLWLGWEHLDLTRWWEVLSAAARAGSGG